MRKIQYTKSVPNSKSTWKDTELEGLFHCWGLEMDEGDEEGRFNSYSVAIIEEKDGTIYTQVPHKIKFIKED